MFNKPNKIFCLSTQRTGTTSVGVFFKQFGYKVADWTISNKNKWSYKWDRGDFEAIFNSKDFKNNQVFEDDPWWLPEFYKVLYHRFPNAKFILFTRNPEDWFKSMEKHSNGKTLGNTKRHCKVYRRELDFYNLLDYNERLHYDEKQIDNLLSLDGYKEHYIKLYNLRNTEIIEFFKKENSKSLVHCELEDKNKWKKLGDFFKLDVPENFEVHANKSL
jgi:hypothetical protein